MNEKEDFSHVSADLNPSLPVNDSERLICDGCGEVAPRLFVFRLGVIAMADYCQSCFTEACRDHAERIREREEEQNRQRSRYIGPSLATKGPIRRPKTA